MINEWATSGVPDRGRRRRLSNEELGACALKRDLAVARKRRGLEVLSNRRRSPALGGRFHWPRGIRWEKVNDNNENHKVRQISSIKQFFET